MRTVRISDITLKQEAYLRLTFREKLEIVKLLNQLKVDVIEADGIHHAKTDSICLKAYAQSVENSVLAVPVSFGPAGVQEVWEAIKEARSPRLQVPVPCSSVQMEYQYHLKPEGMKNLVMKTLEECRTLCADVELVALDATRSEEEFLASLVESAIQAGATTVTVCEDAGNMLPEEFREFIRRLKQQVPSLEKVNFGISCCNKLSVADMCAFSGILEGAGEVKSTMGSSDRVSLPNLTQMLEIKGEAYGVGTGIKTVELKRLTEKIREFVTREKSAGTPFTASVLPEQKENNFTVHDSMETVVSEITRLGYHLTPEDNTAVYDEFLRIASKKPQVTTKELEALVATAALDVPPTYKIDHYVINSGNTISATSYIRLIKDGKPMDAVSLGDGAVDASFLAIEQITGRHYELDDFQIQAVTEGREAMGETIVRLRFGGRLYSGRGISTDIVGSSIQAYVNALNKIAYEEAHT